MSWKGVSSDKSNHAKFHFLFLSAMSLSTYVLFSFFLNRADDIAHLDADESEYYDLAGQIIHGTYTFDLRRTPIHALMLFIIRIIAFDNLRAMHVMVSLIFGLSGPLMYILVRRITNNNLLALSVGVCTIFWPPFLYYGSTLYSETTALPLFIGVLILIPMGSIVAPNPSPNIIRSIFAGMILGICLLVRPMYLLFCPFAVAILFMEESNWNLASRRAALLTAGCLMVVLPWSAFITSKAGTPILISANGGETLAGGLNPVLVENGYRTVTVPGGRQTWSGPGKWLPDYLTGYLNDDEQKLPYIQRDALLRRRAMSWVARNPGSALYIERAKLTYMWGLYPFWNGAKQTFLGNVPSIIALILSVSSLVRFRGRLRQLSRFWLPPLFVSLVALISWGSWRFRQPGDLGLITLSVLFLWSLFVSPTRLLGADLERRSVMIGRRET